MTAAAPAPPALLFRERLTPSPVVALIAAITGAVFGVILVPLSVLAAVIVGIVLAVSAVVLLLLTAPVIEVAPDRVVAGPARIEPELLGDPQLLEGQDWADTMGQEFEPLAYHCTRGWLHAGVRVPIHDDQDPTTAWVISSRRPEELALALTAAHATEASDDGAVARP